MHLPSWVLSCSLSVSYTWNLRVCVLLCLAFFAQHHSCDLCTLLYVAGIHPYSLWCSIPFNEKTVHLLTLLFTSEPIPGCGHCNSAVLRMPTCIPCSHRQCWAWGSLILPADGAEPFPKWLHQFTLHPTTSSSTASCPHMSCSQASLLCVTKPPSLQGLTLHPHQWWIQMNQDSHFKIHRVLFLMWSSHNAWGIEWLSPSWGQETGALGIYLTCLDSGRPEISSQAHLTPKSMHPFLGSQSPQAARL